MGSSKLVILALIVSIVAFSEGKPYGDDNNDLYANDEYEDLESADERSNGADGKASGSQTNERIIHTLPKFITTSQNMMVNEGSTIKLPCIVNRLEGFVLLWKKGDEIITVGQQIINRNDKRLQLQPEANGNNLIISLAEENDAGDYKCQVSTYKPTEIVHSVKIRVKPAIKPNPDNGVMVAEEHDSVTLACEVTHGFPTPEVTWHRKERKMPGGEDSVRGLSVTFPSVTRHHSGHYICSADNGFGQPSQANIKLDVQHPPEIENEETYIHTSEGDKTEVICIVHASPKAEVTWYKDGERLEPTTHVIDHRGNRHTLTIAGIEAEHFGTYSCKAQNQYGEDKKSTVVTGKAEPANINSDPKGPENDRFSLEWNARSLTPINRFKIQYKGLQDDTWSEEEVEAYPIPNAEHLYTGTFMVQDLAPASVYMARVSSHNQYGYSDHGQVFQFATRGADPVQKPMTGSGSSTWIASVTSLVLCSIGLHLINMQ